MWWAGAAIDLSFATDLKDAVCKPLREQTLRQREKALYRYWLSMRKTFDSPRFIHVALDGGTVFRKSMVCGLISEAGGFGMVYPPQARSSPCSG